MWTEIVAQFRFLCVLCGILSIDSAVNPTPTYETAEKGTEVFAEDSERLSCECEIDCVRCGLLS